MGKCTAEIKKVLFVVEPEVTQCYVAVQAEGDCPVGVQGWHHKTFPGSIPMVDILAKHLVGGTGEDGYLLWPLNAPH